MDLQEIIRKYFRINVKGNEAFSIKVNNVPYELLEIGDTGIGIKLTSEDIFFTVEDKLPIELKAEDQIYNFQGKVIHISPSGPEDFLCGIEFMNVDKDTQTKWMNFVQSSREKIFKEE